MACEHTDPWRGPEGVPTVTQLTREWVRARLKTLPTERPSLSHVPAASPDVFMGHFSRRLRSGRECAGVTTFMGREQLAQDG